MHKFKQTVKWLQTERRAHPRLERTTPAFAHQPSSCMQRTADFVHQDLQPTVTHTGMLKTTRDMQPKVTRNFFKTAPFENCIPESHAELLRHSGDSPHEFNLSASAPGCSEPSSKNCKGRKCGMGPAPYPQSAQPSDVAFSLQSVDVQNPACSASRAMKTFWSRMDLNRAMKCSF